ncbi:Permease of the drug/metabolite transporter (DMT) superfamily [Parageobacillus thermantarcticus]|uniref:Permease of the drug/metabolite transporter (DMT) superfamily n=1 Tax=Parageobacillus thermantarcticus TaxID=186116 RepID=A0A1I0TQS7_9BACL|nr:EamA family transporter [Parageobacillus thermantarcticus]SFA54161.1 Permease of the drug/metabolite transporter (DMT) superfamily [Parageobacillus thermantarcticus]
MNAKEMASLFLLAALWGASFLFMRIASPVIGPVLTIELRVLIAGIVLLLYVWMFKKSVELKAYWKQYLIVGALNAAIPFTLIATATLHLPASVAAILNSTTPLFTALTSRWFLHEPLYAKKWIGIGLDIIGVFALVGWSPVSLSTQTIVSTLLSILAAFSYGCGGVYAKKTFAGVSSLSLSIGQQLGAAAVLIPLVAFDMPTKQVSTLVVYSILGLAVFCTAIAYLFYFYLLANVGPTKTLSVTFLVPVFGVIWGMIFLHEKISIGMIGGLAVILTSIFLLSDVKIAVKRQEYIKG